MLHVYYSASSITLFVRFLNDADFFGRFTQEDLDQLYTAMQSNYKSWCLGFAPLMVGGDMDSVAVQEFSRALFNVRPDIAVRVVQTSFESDVRQKLGLVIVPCHIIQSMKDMVVPIVVSEFMHQNLDGKCIVEVIQTEDHHPQLRAPEIVIPVILRHIMYDIST